MDQPMDRLISDEGESRGRKWHCRGIRYAIRDIAFGREMRNARSAINSYQ